MPALRARPHVIRRRRAGLAATAVVAASLVGLQTLAGPPAGAAAHAKRHPRAPSGNLTVYAALTTAGGAGFANAFEHKYPKVHVTMVTSGTGKLEAQIQAQRQSGTIQPDVVFFADPASMGVLNREHILSRWRPPVREHQLPPGYLGNGWIGAMSFEDVILYHAGMANPPTSWKSLISPSLAGKVAIGDPSYSGTTFAIVSELSSLYGWSYYEKLKKNGVRVEKSTTTVGNDVATGLDEAGITLDSVARSLLAKGAPVKVVWPTAGAVGVPAPIGITKTTQNPVAAKAFVSWMMSRQGQVAAANLGYDPALLASRAHPKLAPVPRSAQQLNVNWKRAGAHQGDIDAHFARIFGT